MVPPRGDPRRGFSVGYTITTITITNTITITITITIIIIITTVFLTIITIIVTIFIVIVVSNYSLTKDFPTSCLDKPHWALEPQQLGLLSGASGGVEWLWVGSEVVPFN